MGTNYCLKYKGERIADLGRTHRTEDIDEDTLAEAVTELKTLAAYAPKDIEEMGDMTWAIDEIVETILNCGEKRLIDYMIMDEPDLEIGKD